MGPSEIKSLNVKTISINPGVWEQRRFRIRQTIFVKLLFFRLANLTEADPDLKLGEGGVLVPPAFLPSVIFSFFTQNKGRRWAGWGPLSFPKSATA